MDIGYGIAWLCIIIAFIWDIRTLTIPNLLSIFTAVAGIAYIFTIKGMSYFPSAIISVVIIFVFMLILYVLKGIGAGDVKFIAALGFLLDWRDMIQLIAISFIAAGIIGILLLGYKAMVKLVRKQSLHGGLLRKGDSIPLVAFLPHVHQFPFMLAVLPAAAITYFY